MSKQASLPIVPPEPPTMPELAPLPVVVSAEQLIAKAIEHSVPIETMERLLAMRDRLKAEQAREAFFAALSGFQADCPIIPKTKTAGSGGYTYKYAPLDVIVDTVRALLAKHSLSFTVQSQFTDTHVMATATVHHVGGHSESSEFRAPIDKGARMNDIQKTAAAQTYAKRYAFCNALGILSGDEDTDAQSPPMRRATVPDPTATVERIKELAEAKDIPLDVILKHYSVESFDDLTADERTDAVERLRKAKTKVGQ